MKKFLLSAITILLLIFLCATAGLAVEVAPPHIGQGDCGKTIQVLSYCFHGHIGICSQDAMADAEETNTDGDHAPDPGR